MGGGGKGGSAPDTPDYEAAARATAKGNLEAAKYATQANRPTQITPWGTVEWDNGSSFDQSGYDKAMADYERQLAEYNNKIASSANNLNRYSDNYANANPWNTRQNNIMGIFTAGKAPEAPKRGDFWNEGNDWTQTITLSPEMQAILDQQNQLQLGLFGAQNAAADRVNDVMGTGFDESSLPGGGNPLDINSLPGLGDIYDPNQDTNNATELLMARMNPELDRQYEQLRSQLANQGIMQGSEAYNREMDRFGQQRNDAVNQASLAGIGLGMQQQGQTFGQQTTNQQLAAALQNQQFGQSEQARQRALAEQAYFRSLPLNELNALRTGNQVSMPQFPGFAQQATTGGPDLLGAANAQYQADLGAYNAQQAQNSGFMGGLLGIGSGILGAAGNAGGLGKLFTW